LSRSLPNPEIILPGPHNLIGLRDSAIFIVFCLCIEHSETSKPEGSHNLIMISLFDNSGCILFLHRMLANPEPRNCRPKAYFHFTIWHFLFGFVCAVGVRKPRNPKPLNPICLHIFSQYNYYSQNRCNHLDLQFECVSPQLLF